VDYNEVFAPVAKYSTICLLCALVILFDLVFNQMDVVMTFMYGSLNEVIFMRQPQGSFVKGKEQMVCTLLKSLYSLKQSPTQWNNRFNDFIHTHELMHNVYDHCVYLKKVQGVEFGLIILVMYIDDMLIASHDRSEVDNLKVQLKYAFSIKDLGPVRRFLA
jgi:Reverse transcriptase (RNA-dependent DNA polymerase)